MRAHRTPAEMTPEDRFREIAAILARGILRLRNRRAAPVEPGSDESCESVAVTPISQQKGSL